MKAAEIEPILVNWMVHHQAVNEQLETLFDSLYADPGSPLIESIYRVMDAHTKAVALRVGDLEGWLSWFEHEADFGKGKTNTVIINDKTIRVRTIKQLARIVASK